MRHAAAWLDAYLDPRPFQGEALRFDLASYHSAVTRQMLQARLRKTPLAFAAGGDLLAANVTADGAALLVDAAALRAANGAVKARLAAGPAGAVDLLRRMATARDTLDRHARRFGATVLGGARPSPAALVGYLDASATDQALGALKFCLPEDLKPRLSAWLGGDAERVGALLSPDAPSLWTRLKGRELALAALRHDGPAGLYRARLARHRRAFGFVFDEDIGFRDQETPAAIDARVAALGSGERAGVAQARRALRQALRADRDRKLRARRVFAEQLAAGGAADAPRLVSHVLLARALTGHEEQNRQGKMRLLRDLRDLADLAGLNLEAAGLRDFAAACAPSASAGPVLRSLVS